MLDPELAAGRVIVAHLGNGASLCAVRAGSSIASTMGFTAADGLMTGTRCGALDPGVILYLMDQRGMDARAIEKLIYQQSGLLGVSGISSDMRTFAPFAGRGGPRGDRSVRLPHCARDRLAGRGPRRRRRIGFHRRDWRERCRRRDRKWRIVAVGSASSSTTSALHPRGRHQHCGQPGCRLVILTDEERMIARHTVSVLAAEVEAPRVA